MAERPVFISLQDGTELVKEVFFAITWHGGFAPVQKKKNVAELHSAAAAGGYKRLLEVSTKSDEKVGRHLSAFHLKTHTEVGEIPLECAFQGSKVFERGGPFRDLYLADVRAAKKDPRLHDSGRIVEFRFGDVSFPLEPKTAFYDWLYLRAIYPHREWLTRLYEYAGFTDIEFNPQRSINCQARSCALFVSLAKRGLLEEAMDSPLEFVKLLVAHRYAPALRTEQGHPGLFHDLSARPGRSGQPTSPWNAAKTSEDASSSGPIFPICDLVARDGFPYSARDKMVRIRDIVGIITEVADDGLTFVVRDRASGQMRTFHTRCVCENFSNPTGNVQIPSVTREKVDPNDHDACLPAGIPICLARWYHANDMTSQNRLLDRTWRGIPEAKRPDVEIFSATNRQEFERGIRGWLEANENAQYLLTASHGILDDSGTAVGIGSVPRGQETGPTADQMISWLDLFRLLTVDGLQPPHLLMIGCRTSDAAAAMSGLLARDQEAPYLVGLSGVVDESAMHRTGRLIGRLVSNIPELILIDREVEAVREEFPEAVFHYPVTHLADKPPKYVDLANFDQEVGMTFVEYMGTVNELLRERAEREDDAARLEGL